MNSINSLKCRPFCKNSRRIFDLIIIFISFSILSFSAHSARPKSPSCAQEFARTVILDEESEFQNRMNDFLGEFPAGKHVSGVLKIVGPGKNYERVFNLANDATGAQNNLDTSFLIASASKQFAAAAILKLEQDKRLSVADSVSYFFPEYDINNLTSLNGTPVRIWNLLTHTSGIPDANDDPNYDQKLLKVKVTIHDVLEAIKNQPLNANPGETFRYSDTNYELIAEIIRRVTGMSYADYLDETFFKPLKMKSTHAGYKKSLGSNLAVSYNSTVKKKDGSRVDYFKQQNDKINLITDTFGSGCVFSSANDMNIWLQALLHDHILWDESLQKMWAGTSASNYGFGWSIQQDDFQNSMFQHNGAWAGYSAQIAVFPDEGTSVVWLSNAPVEDKDGQDFRGKLLEMVWGRR